jgi:hypothetical protein
MRGAQLGRAAKSKRREIYAYGAGALPGLPTLLGTTETFYNKCRPREQSEKFFPGLARREIKDI